MRFGHANMLVCRSLLVVASSMEVVAAPWPEPDGASRRYVIVALLLKLCGMESLYLPSVCALYAELYMLQVQQRLY